MFIQARSPCSFENDLKVRLKQIREQSLYFSEVLSLEESPFVVKDDS